MKELASIVIVTCNRLTFAKLTLESIFKNTDFPYELIIIDNGSKDGTVEYLKSIENRQEVSHLILNSNNKGKPAAANKGFALAQGNYIVGLDDDVILPEKWLSTVVKALKTIPKVGWLSLNLENFKNNNKFSPKYERKFGDLTVQEIPGVAGFCVAMNHSTYKKLGGYAEGKIYGSVDGEYLKRARNHGLLCGYLMNVIGIHLGGTDKEAELYPEYREYKYQTQDQLKKRQTELSRTDFYTERDELLKPEVLKRGQLLKSKGPAVYFVYKGKKHLIPSMGVFKTLNFQWENVKIVPQSELDKIPEGIILHLPKK